jgi:Bacterial membrane protein YfhO
VSSTLVVAADRDRRNAERAGTRTVLIDAAAIAAIAICALVLHRDGLFGGPAFYELDTRLFYYPLAQWVGQQLEAGVFPLWLPGVFTGYPIFADGELGLAYLPQVLLLYLLPTPLAMVWMRVLHVFLAGLFTYLYLKTLRLDPLPALGGALVFAFGSFLTAQMHHENVVRSAVWLPAVLTSAERAVQQRRAAFRASRFALWTALGALAFSQSALGLHVQPVLMLALALGAYVLFRALIPVRGEQAAPRNAYWPVVTGAAIVGAGLGLAAVQWLPLGEWALVSSRRGGVDYEFGSAFGLAPENLPTVIFPYFFRLPDATLWWSLWQQWEIELYVGIPTLALATVGIVFSRRIELVYFVLLAAVSLLIGMAPYAPFFNLHQILWSIPGFSFLRAPGRFSYLVVFAFACLAGFGLQALGQRRLRLAVAVVGGVPSVALLAALLALLPTWRAFLMDDPARARAFVEATYLATRAQYPIDPGLVVGGLLSSLDFGNPKTAWSLVLLGLTCLGFVVWLELGARRAVIGQGLFVGLLAVDLLVFASDFHPRAPLASLAPALPQGVTAGTRVLLRDATDLPALEPNQLLADGVAAVQGYSSLPSQRHVELEAATSAQPNLFDLWGAPLVVVDPAHPSDFHEIDGVRFRAQHPLAAGFGGAPTTLIVPPDVGTIASLRLVGTLSYAFRVPQGQTVATLTANNGALHDVGSIRAGMEFSERAYDRPSLSGLLQHQKARVAIDFEDVTPEGEDYPGHLYEADIILPQAATLRSITITPTNPEVLVEIHGLALIDASGAANSLSLGDRDGLQRLSGDQVLRATQALPRAYVLPRAQAYSTARHAGLTATQLVASPDVNLHTMLLVEGDPSTPQDPSGSQLARAATRVEDLGPNAVRITATADTPSYLVLEDFYHRGWTVHVDGQPGRVLIANALFRAVVIEPGTHTIEFRFEPVSHLLGVAVSALTLLVMLLAIGWGLRSR